MWIGHELEKIDLRLITSVLFTYNNPRHGLTTYYNSQLR